MADTSSNASNGRRGEGTSDIEPRRLNPEDEDEEEEEEVSSSRAFHLLRPTTPRGRCGPHRVVRNACTGRIRSASPTKRCGARRTVAETLTIPLAHAAVWGYRRIHTHPTLHFIADVSARVPRRSSWSRMTTVWRRRRRMGRTS
jgi:hypothetical protein